MTSDALVQTAMFDHVILSQVGHASKKKPHHDDGIAFTWKWLTDADGVERLHKIDVGVNFDHWR